MSRKKNRSSHRNKSDLRSESGAKPKKEKRRYLQNQKEKFRKSKEWKEFRSHMAIVFGHRDYITGKRLVKGFNLHHLKTEQTSETYCDISHEEEFIPLNSYCHKLLHYLFTIYQKDKTVIERLVEILDKMCALVPKGVDIVDDEDYGEETEPFVAGQDDYNTSEDQFIDHCGFGHTVEDYDNNMNEVPTKQEIKEAELIKKLIVEEASQDEPELIR